MSKGFENEGKTILMQDSKHILVWFCRLSYENNITDTKELLWSDKPRFCSNIAPRLSTGQFGVNVGVDAESRLRDTEES